MIHGLLDGKKILIAVAHPDDIEFIMGGTLNFYHDKINGGHIDLRCMTYSLREKNTNEYFRDTKKHQEESFKVLGLTGIEITNLKFRARFLPTREDDIRLILKKHKEEFNPDIIFTHYVNDTNQDHVSVVNQVMRVFPDKTIIGGEISNTGRNLRPNLFIGLSKANVVQKAKALSCYKAESYKYYFSEEIILTQARFRGNQSITFDYAEAFEIYNMLTGVKRVRL
jgi:LmbE family N-acetylglucosaminyl deacetylase